MDKNIGVSNIATGV